VAKVTREPHGADQIMEPNHHIWPLGHMDCGSEEKGSRGLLLFLVLLGLLVDEIVA
jgi:hypothetical protein